MVARRSETSQLLRIEEPHAGALSLEKEATAANKQMVYLVTFPHPKKEESQEGIALEAPPTLGKEMVLKALLDWCSHLVALRTWIAVGPVKTAKAGVWREFHQEGADGETHCHDHAALLAEVSFRYLPVKRALLLRHGLPARQHWQLLRDQRSGRQIWDSCVATAATSLAPMV